MAKHLKWLILYLFIAAFMFAFTDIPLYFSLFVFADSYLVQGIFKDEALKKESKFVLMLIINIIGWSCELFLDLRKEYLSFDFIITLICILGFIERVYLYRFKNQMK